MNLASAVSLAALLLALVVVGLGSMGLYRARHVYDRLHYGGPVNILAPVALALAFGLTLGVASPTTIRCLLLIPLMAITGPIVAHATARAARLQARETLEVCPDDGGAPR